MPLTSSGTGIPLHRKPESSQTRIPKSKKRRPRLHPDPEVEDQLLQLYDLIPASGPGPKRSTVFCKLCESALGFIHHAAPCDDLTYLAHAADIHGVVLAGESERDQPQMEEDMYDEDSVKAVFLELPFHEDLVVPHLHGQTKMEEDEYIRHSVKADFSERQLRQLFELDDLSDPSKGLREVVCKLCGGYPDSIQEGSSLQDCRAVQEHASIHRDIWHDLPNQWVDQNTSMEITKPKSYSEAELLRIYVLDSYCIPGYKRQGVPPHIEQVNEPDQVYYAVICKLCYGDVYKTQNKPNCLHKIPKLQHHALRHSEYLCVDGLPVPELDLEDYKKEWLTGDEYGFLSFEDDAPLHRGFVKICCWCMCKKENCSSGEYGTVRIQCDACDDIGTHRTYECPNWQRELGELIPCNGLKRITTTLLESLKEDA